MRQFTQITQTEKRRRLITTIKADSLLIAKCSMHGVEFFSRPAPICQAKNPFLKKNAA